METVNFIFAKSLSISIVMIIIKTHRDRSRTSFHLSKSAPISTTHYSEVVISRRQQFQSTEIYLIAVLVYWTTSFLWKEHKSLEPVAHS
jgi:hypothetical protein